MNEHADSGPESPASPAPHRSVDPLSTAHRKRLLKALAAAAAKGDHQATRVLLEVGALLDRMRADDRADGGGDA